MEAIKENNQFCDAVAEVTEEHNQLCAVVAELTAEQQLYKEAKNKKKERTVAIKKKKDKEDTIESRKKNELLPLLTTTVLEYT